MSTIRRLIIRLGLARTHRYAQTAAGYAAWLTAPLLGVVGFLGVDGELTTNW